MKATRSTVLKGSKDYADEGFLAAHEPFRCDMAAASHVLQEKFFDGSVQWKVFPVFPFISDPQVIREKRKIDLESFQGSDSFPSLLLVSTRGH